MPAGSWGSPFGAGRTSLPLIRLGSAPHRSRPRALRPPGGGSLPEGVFVPYYTLTWEFFALGRERLTERGVFAVFIARPGAFESPTDPAFPLLTDDQAPVDQLIYEAFFRQ